MLPRPAVVSIRDLSRDKCDRQRLVIRNMPIPSPGCPTVINWAILLSPRSSTLPSGPYRIVRLLPLVAGEPRNHGQSTFRARQVRYRSAPQNLDLDAV
jgi:hypothetical protein